MQRFVHQVLRGCHPSAVLLPCASGLTESRQQAAAGSSSRQQEERGERAGSDRQRNSRAKLRNSLEESPGAVACSCFYSFVYLFDFISKKGAFISNKKIYIHIKINSHTVIYSGWQPCWLSLHTMDKIYQKLHTKSRNCRKPCDICRQVNQSHETSN